MLLNFVAMLRVSGLDLNQSDHSDQVKKLLKYVADVSRKIEERHQVCIAIILVKQYDVHSCINVF